MADYDWFVREPASDSDETTYGNTADYTVLQKDPQAGAINQYKRQLYAETVWCNFCQCSIRPKVVYMREHRRVCATDPHIAGEDSESIKKLINGIRKLDESRTNKD